MTAKELLENLISDLEDTIDDYTDTINRPRNRLEPHEYKIRRDELIGWKKSLKIILSEME